MCRAVAAEERLAVEYDQVKGVPVMAKVLTTPANDLDLATEEITFHVMSPEEAWDRFDQAAQHYLHMSGDAFIGAWDAGAFDEHPDHSNVMCVAMLRPHGR